MIVAIMMKAVIPCSEWDKGWNLRQKGTYANLMWLSYLN